MEVYLDKDVMKLLKYIKRHPNNTLKELQERFGDVADSLDLINLCMSDYLVCKHPDGSCTMFKDPSTWKTFADDNFWITPKGKYVLNEHYEKLLQWAIPVIISTIALVVSVLSATNPGIIKVLLI